MRLSEAPINRQCTVISLNQSDEAAFGRLLSMGILPGAKLTLVNKYPSPICQVGAYRLVLAQSLADMINVK